jgi:hypothetical protein
MNYNQKLKSLESRLVICQNHLENHQRRLEIISAKLDQLAERMRPPTMSEGERAVDTMYYKPAPRQKKIAFGEKELADLNSVDNLEIDNLWSQ